MTAAGDLTVDALGQEFRSFADGVKAFAESLQTSGDMDELRLFVATVAEWRNGLYDAETPATCRLQELEIAERHSSLSWTATS